MTRQTGIGSSSGSVAKSATRPETQAATRDTLRHDLGLEAVPRGVLRCQSASF